MSEIELEGVTKTYADGTLAVDDLSLRIDDGEFMILVGPSGCGKSTTLRMIAGLESMTRGDLRIGGESVAHRSPKDRDLAMVFQSYALYPHMTVAKNMGFGLRLSGADRKLVDRKVREAAEILDLTEQLGRKPAQLSGGQRQRVAMGRAIVRDPKAFLMDEPLSNLDAKLRVQMRASIARIQHRLRTTTVYVTHDQTEAMTLGDRVAVMRAGVLQQVAPPQELYERPVNLFVAGFMGSPAMNLFACEVDDQRLRLPIGDVPITGRHAAALSAAGRRDGLVAGLRPEAFEDAALAGDRPGMVFDADVELVESLGSDMYAYILLDQPATAADTINERALEHDLADSESREGRVIARLSPETTVREPGRARLWVDPERLHLFDAETGRALAA
jgi:multiple sugar transport system ATP-binding protein